MKLKELVINKINELGVAEAAKYFGKSEASIKMWQKGKIPLEAVEKIMADDEVLDDGQPALTPPPVTPVSHDSELEVVWARLAELNGRISVAESFLMEHFPMAFNAPAEPPQPQTSVIEPIPSRVIPPVVTEASLKDNKPAGMRSPNAAMQQPVPVAQPQNGQLEAPWVPDPRSWSRPHNFNRR